VSAVAQARELPIEDRRYGLVIEALAELQSRQKWDTGFHVEVYSTALAEGGYLRLLALLRDLVDESEPSSYDPLAYLLQAVVGRYADADAACQRRAERQRPLGMQALPEAVRVALLQRPAETTLPAQVAEVTPDEAAAALVQAAHVCRAVILAEEHISPEHRAFGRGCYLRCVPRESPTSRSRAHGPSACARRPTPSHTWLPPPAGGSNSPSETLSSPRS
jgi:hypothetical protein